MYVYRQNYRTLFENASGNQTIQHSMHSTAMVGPYKARIDDDSHRNLRIDLAGELAGGFIVKVDFPCFVKYLLKGVFDATIEVTLAQMESYHKLIKAASQSVFKFISAIVDAASSCYLSKNNSDEFGLGFSDKENEVGPRN